MSKEIAFSDVLGKVGSKPRNDLSQDELRSYSEKFSKQVAYWLNEKLGFKFPSLKILPPEGKVDTVFGKGNQGKSLDVGALTSSNYLAIDISIKTFNFRDRKSKNYRHNFTGRFYELLGEELDLRKSYEHSVLVGVIFLPADGAEELEPSCFARCVKQFAKAAKSPIDATPFGFDLIFLGIHFDDGEIYFFDVRNAPPKKGHPRIKHRLSIDEVMSAIGAIYDSRRTTIEEAPLPVTRSFVYDDPES